jgi:large subunit ribosomal protein L30
MDKKKFEVRSLKFNDMSNPKPRTSNLEPQTSNILNMKKIKITLVKSPIDRPKRQKLTLQALGLNKTNSSKEVEATPQVLGMVKKVEHMVKVEEI